MTQFISHINTREFLIGEQAFYNQPDYEDVKNRELRQKETLPVSFSFETESKIIRIVKKILSFIIFPIAIYNGLHSLIGRILVPAATPKMMGLPSDFADQARGRLAEMTQNVEWKVKRFTVEVDGTKIDAMVVGHFQLLANSKRWVLAAGGNGEFYETTLSDRNFGTFLTNLSANAIVFNYPGVGASSGGPNRQTMVKAYQAMLKLLEDKENGFGATEIFGVGHSIGGGVQGDALRTHELKEDIKYVFIKHKSFSTMSRIAAAITKIAFIGHLIKFFGWNFNSLESSRKLNVPEVIIQTSKEPQQLALQRGDQVENDGIITAETSLAKELLDAPQLIQHPEMKRFIGVPEGHNNNQIFGDRDFARGMIQLLV